MPATKMIGTSALLVVAITGCLEKIHPDPVPIPLKLRRPAVVHGEGFVTKAVFLKRGSLGPVTDIECGAAPTGRVAIASLLDHRLQSTCTRLIAYHPYLRLNSRSHHAAPRNNAASPNSRPTSCNPSGKPSADSPIGNETVGNPT